MFIFIIKPTLDLSGYAYHHFTQLMFMICGVFRKTFLIYLCAAFIGLF